jgi:hypothetical protein
MYYDDGDMMGGGGEVGGGGVVDDGNLNIGCEFINGQWVCPTPELSSNTQQPTIKKKSINGTRSSYYWDSNKNIEKLTKPLSKKKKS